MPPTNLLFIFTDEQRFDTLAATGGAHVAMPNVDRLAEQSCLFEETYCSQPVCTPSRSSILTGLYPHVTGAANNNLPLKSDVACLPELMDREGRQTYATGYHGKWHLGDEIFAQHGFSEWRSIEDYFYRDHFSPGRDRDALSTYSQWLRNNGFKPDLGNTFSRERASTLPERFGKPAYLANEACRFLTEHREQPFVLYVNFLEPHMPFFGPRTNQYDPATLPLPANFNHVPDDDDAIKLRLFAEQYRRRGYDWYNLDCEQGWRQLAAAYFGLCTLVDHHVGRILNTLHSLGLDENTVVVFTSDHGEMLGSHRSVGKMLMHQESARVPCLIRLPGQTRGQRITGPFSQIDLVPTLLELLGQTVPSHLHGRSRAGLLGGSDTRLTEDVFLQWNEPGPNDGEQRPRDIPSWMADLAGSEGRARTALSQANRTIVTPDGWRLTVNAELDDHELFDLTHDRQERHNLAQSPEHRERMNSLLLRIKTWQKQVADPVHIPDHFA